MWPAAEDRKPTAAAGGSAKKRHSARMRSTRSRAGRAIGPSHGHWHDLEDIERNPTLPRLRLHDGVPMCTLARMAVISKKNLMVTESPSILYGGSCGVAWDCSSRTVVVNKVRRTNAWTSPCILCGIGFPLLHSKFKLRKYLRFQATRAPKNRFSQNIPSERHVDTLDHPEKKD